MRGISKILIVSIIMGTISGGIGFNGNIGSYNMAVWAVGSDDDDMDNSDTVMEQPTPTPKSQSKDSISTKSTSTDGNLISNTSPTLIDTNIQGKSYEKAVETLIALGIVDENKDGSFKPENPVTRAEISAFIVRALGLQDVDSSDQKIPFNDIPSDSVVKNSIMVAYNLGIIQGYGDGRFDPEGSVTYEQAVKMIVCALGYEVLAQQKGGYPAGYLVIAAETGITKNVEGISGSIVKRGTVAQLLYNALDVDIMEKAGYGTDRKYNAVKGKTLLTNKLNISKLTGQVIANANTSLTKSSNLLDDEVFINDVIYKVGKTNAKEYLGYIVDYYALEEKGGDKPVLLLISPKGGINNELTITAENISQVSYISGSHDIKMGYWKDKDKDNKVNDLTIEGTADIIYNGIAYPNYSINELKPDAGNVKLLDTDNNGEYDIVFVTQYDNYVVMRTFSDSRQVIDQYRKDGNQVLELDEKSLDYKVEMEKNGEPIQFNDIKEWNVLSVAQSRNTNGKKFKKVIVSDQKINGSVKEKGTDKMTIEDKEYGIASNYTETINIDDKGTFYLDVEGKIAGANITYRYGRQYGYLFKVRALNGVGSRYQFKLLNAKNQWVIYEAEDKIRLNDVPTNLGSIYNELTEIKYKDPNGLYHDENVPGGIETRVTRKQLINYEVNEQDKITSIVLSGQVSDKDAIRVSTPKNPNNVKKVYKQENLSFQSEVYMDTSTAIFKVPNSLARQDVEEEYKVVDTDYFITDLSYLIETYNESDFGVAKALIVYEDTRAIIQADSPMVLVCNISNIVNEEGDDVQKLTGLCLNKETSWVTEKKDTLNTVSPGDIIRISKNLKGQINDFIPHFRINQDINAQKGIVGTYTSDDQTVCGVIYDIYKTFVLVGMPTAAGATTPPNRKWKINYSKPFIYLYDQKKDQGSIINLSKLEKGMLVFMRFDDARSEEVIAYKLRNSR